MMVWESLGNNVPMKDTCAKQMMPYACYLHIVPDWPRKSEGFQCPSTDVWRPTQTLATISDLKFFPATWARTPTKNHEDTGSHTWTPRRFVVNFCLMCWRCRVLANIFSLVKRPVSDLQTTLALGFCCHCHERSPGTTELLTRNHHTIHQYTLHKRSYVPNVEHSTWRYRWCSTLESHFSMPTRQKNCLRRCQVDENAQHFYIGEEVEFSGHFMSVSNNTGIQASKNDSTIVPFHGADFLMCFHNHRTFMRQLNSFFWRMELNGQT